MIPYKKKSVDDQELVKEIMRLYKKKFPKDKIKYENGVFYIVHPKEEYEVLSYVRVKMRIEGNGVSIPNTQKERVSWSKKFKKTKNKK